MGLISHKFILSMRDMLGTPTVGVNKCQVPSVIEFYFQNIPMFLVIYFLKIGLK